MTKEEEKQIRELISKVLTQELSKATKEFDVKLKKAIGDSESKQKKEFLSNLKKELDSIDKRFLTKKEIKNLMVAAFVRHNRFAWEKSKFLTSYFNEL